ncbi:MAG: ABC transporter ATP-binding protein [Patescibacteria group bacterium]
MSWNQLRAVRFIKLVSNGFGKYKWGIGVMVFLGFFSGLLEGVGVGSLIPLFSLLTKSSGGPGAQDALTQFIGSFFNLLGLSFTLKYLLLFIAGLFILRSLMLILSNWIKVRISANYEYHKRQALLELFLDADWSFLLKQRLGHLETVLMTNVRYATLVLENTSSLIIIVTNLAVYVLIAFSISAPITAMTLILGVVFFWFLKSSFGKTRKNSRIMETVNKTIAHFLNENVMGMKTVKTMAVANSIATVGKNDFEQYRNAYVKIAFQRSLGDALMQPMGVVFICFLFAFYYKTAAFQLGAFAAIVYLIQRIFTYFQAMQSNYRALNEYAPYLQSVNMLEDEMKSRKEKTGSASDFVFKKSFDFDDVGFAYAQDRPILNSVSFSVKRGEIVGIVGPSGAGKTTLMDLALRLLDPSSGKILLDGRDVSEINLDKWRNSIGYVSQDMFLLNGTIAENIRFYKRISDAEIEEAAKSANIYDFIQTLPNKFETLVGERGTMLSNGQRQRIIIARILARKPKLLVLDEATSALDNESEVQIQNVIESLKGKITVLIIAHRLSTVLCADRIMALSEGKIIEQGAPQDLLKDPESYFYKVYNVRQ